MAHPDPTAVGGRAAPSPLTGFLDLTVRPFAADLCEPVRGTRALVVGCGDGRLCRALASRGAHAVAGIDRSPTLIGAARRVEREESRGIGYRVLEPELIEPRLDGQFDLAVAAVAFEHVDLESLGLAVGQVGRVLRAGGRLVVCVLHPAFPFVAPADAPLRFDVEGLGWFSAQGGWLAGTVRGRDGEEQPFPYLHKGLAGYLEAFRRAGFGGLPEVVEYRIEEDHLALDMGYFRPLVDQPLFLGFRMRKAGGDGSRDG